MFHNCPRCHDSGWDALRSDSRGQKVARRCVCKGGPEALYRQARDSWNDSWTAERIKKTWIDPPRYTKPDGTHPKGKEER